MVNLGDRWTGQAGVAPVREERPQKASQTRKMGLSGGAKSGVAASTQSKNRGRTGASGVPVRG